MNSLEKFRKFQKESVEYIKNNKMDSFSNNLEYLLFPLIEVLEYDVTEPSEVVSKPVYIEEKDEFFDYGLIEDYRSEEYKVIVKAFEVGVDLSNYDELVSDAFKINKTARYAILTDCTKVRILGNTFNSVDPVELLAEVEPISLYINGDIEESTIRDFTVLKDISKDNAFNVLPFLTGEEDIEEIEDKPKKLKKKEKKEKEPFKFKGRYVIIAVLVVLTLLMALLGSRLKKKGKTPDNNDVINQPKEEIIENNKEKEGMTNIFDGIGNGFESNIAFIEVNSTLELNIDNKEHLFLNLMSNLKEGSVVKFEIINDNNSDVVYGVVDKNGEAKAEYKIPETWNRPTIQVASYLRFDEAEHEQPKHIKKVYGKNGENIIPKKNFPQYGLTHQEINFNNERVDEYLKHNKDQMLSESQRDFAKTSIASDGNGNFKIKPKGYEMNKVNIRENRSIYPEITYNADEDKAYLQIVFGFIDTQWGMFDNIGFIVDGNTWSYPVNSNIRKSKVAGINIAEWAYFNDYDTPRLIKDMQLLANSNEAEILFTGAARKSHIVTMEEKETIRYFLSLYNKYYVDKITYPSEIK